MLKLVSVKETVFGIEVLAKVEPYLEDMQNIENSRMSKQMIDPKLLQVSVFFMLYIFLSSNMCIVFIPLSAGRKLEIVTVCTNAYHKCGSTCFLAWRATSHYSDAKSEKKFFELKIQTE